MPTSPLPQELIKKAEVLITKLESLKMATTLSDVAAILGFRPRALAYILYKKPPASKYKQFEIPKRSGGKRVLNAPSADLKNLQRRLAKVLEACITEINEKRKVNSVLSHGFRPKYSIITNASTHRKSKFVFNIDLENFFGSINFGRVRGFFITNQNFGLNPSVATVLAQIACHENSLPQGSPCSPVITNLIGHIVDIRLAKLAFETGCRYSRYADDLTFSTNEQVFPEKIARIINVDSHQWQVGKGLNRLIQKAGFSVNESKTRMQYKNSRQDVTGLTVNKIVNTKAEYRRSTRAMVHSLLKNGSFKIKTTMRDEAGNLVHSETEGTLNKLHGRLSFIDSVYVHRKDKIKKNSGTITKKDNEEYHLSSFEKTYRSFLFYRWFYSYETPVIIGEGKTDNVYLKYAIRRLADSFPGLGKKNSKDIVESQVKLFERSATSKRLFGLTGGGDEFKYFVINYLAECKKISTKGQSHPVIIFLDNDTGADSVLNYIKKKAKKEDLKKQDFIHVAENLYVVLTPLGSGGENTMIENFFDSDALEKEYKGKTLNLNDKTINLAVHYPKSDFAEHIVKNEYKEINFEKFKSILERIDAVIKEHTKRSAPVT